MSKDVLRYDLMVQDALKGVVRKILTEGLTPDQVIAEVKGSGLRGRGGAGRSVSRCLGRRPAQRRCPPAPS